MNIIGRGFTLAELPSYIASAPKGSWSPRFVVVHNTDEPSLQLYGEWQQRRDWSGEQWLRNLKSYYEGKGWSGGPHLFVGPDKIWAFTPLWRPGVHSPSWNKYSWGVETVGNFDHEPFDGPVRTNLIGTLALLHRSAELDPVDYKLGARGLHFHREDPATTHRDCPGAHMVKEELLADVVSGMGGAYHEHAHPSAAAQAADTTALPPEAGSIRWVQSRLNEVLGTHLTLDNNPGPVTRSAVREFQRRVGLKLVDGIAGPLTRLALAAAAPSGSGH